MALQEYEILEKMTNGTFGIVFKVRRVTDHTVFVMKRIPLLDLNMEQRRDAAQEIAVMRDLHHPCVVEQKDAFLFNEYDLCLILEYYAGGDMDTRMAAQRELDEYFSFEQVMLWFVQLVLGAQYLHAHHVIHRDIKSHNVFVRKEDGSVSLGDFGISERFNTDLATRTWAAATMGGRRGSANSANAREHSLSDPHQTSPSADHDLIHLQRTLSFSFAHLTDEGHPSTPDPSVHCPPQLRHHSSHTETLSPFFGSPQSPWTGGGRMAAAMKGTPLYMAPEVLQGGAASPKSDVWSLGCVLYELLALRHPFESRDLATLVMRVSRGQREPLPPHYPRAIQEVINRMLHLDAAQRPTCEEVLMMPCVRAYAELWATLRAPLDVPSSPSETALSKQLAAWRADVAAAVAKHPTDLRYTPVHYTEVQRQLMPPASAPSEEREATERRAVEAARAALLNAGPSTLQSSASSFGVAAAGGGGGGGVSGGLNEGTFFYGESGCLLAGDMNGFGQGMGGGGPSAGVSGGAAGGMSGDPSDLGSFPSTDNNSSTAAAAAATGVAPTESMRPYMVYDAVPPSDRRPSNPPDSPMSAKHCENSPQKSSCSAAKQRRRRHGQPPPQRKQQGRQQREGEEKQVSPRPVSSSSTLSLTTPATSPIARDEGRRKRHKTKKAKACGGRGDGPGREASSPDPSTGADASFSDGPLPSTSPPPPLCSPVAFPQVRPAKPLRTAGVTPLPPTPTPSLDEEALFFKTHHNVADMRYASMEEIAEAVVRLRLMVQQRMRDQRVLLDIEQVLSSHGSAPLQSMPYALNVLATATAAAVSAEREDTEAAAAAEPDGAKEAKGRGATAGSNGGDGTHRPSTMDEAWATVQAEARNILHPHSHDGLFSMGRSSPSRIRKLRELAALAEAPRGRQQTEIGSSFSAALFADPTAPLHLSTRADTPQQRTALQQRWVPYVRRRNALSQSLTHVFDPVSLRAVYAYYFLCPLLERDARLVRRLVPDRSQWTALPMVEELVVLDRRLQPLLEKAE